MANLPVTTTSVYVGASTVPPQAPQALLQVQPAAAGQIGIALFVAGVNDAVMLYPKACGNSDNGSYNWYFTRGADTAGFFLDPAGNVAFGQNASFLQDVSIGGALKIKNWEISVPDYVFNRDYQLAALHEVASFVRSHGHLPEIPSAAEIEAQGLDAAHMILALLKKVEELTLYLIRQAEQLDSLDERLRAMEAPTEAGASSAA